MVQSVNVLGDQAKPVAKYFFHLNSGPVTVVGSPALSQTVRL